MEDLKTRIETIKSKGRVTSITVSRVVKMPRNGGDVFLSLTSSYGGEEGEGLTTEEARTASHMLSLEVNTLTFKQACAAGILPYNDMERALQATKNNFKHLIVGE